MIDLTPIANAVITLAAALITAFLIPWIKKKINAEQLAELQKWTKIAVEAAEMIYKGSGLGEEKKAACVRSSRSISGLDENAAANFTG